MDVSLTRQMALLFLGRTAAFVFSFALPLVLARIFSAEEFGLYKQLFLIHGTLAAILTLGFSASLYYFVPRHAPREQQAYVAQTVLVLAVAGLLGAGGLIGFASEIGARLNNPALTHYLPYLAAFTVLTLVASLLETLMIVLKRAELASAASFGSELCRSAILTAAALLTHSMVALVLAALLWAAGRMALLLWYLRRLGIDWRQRPQPARLRAQFRFALPFGLALIAWTLANNLHLYAVASVYSPALFAIYSVGCLQIPALAIVFETVSDLTLVRITELHKEGRLDDAVALLGASVTKLGLILFPVYAWFLLQARDVLLLLYTDKFAGSVEIFQVFLATIPLAALELDYIARAFADTRFILQINLIRLLLSGLLLLILMEPLGPVGAALATVVATGLTKMLTLLKLRTLFERPVIRLLPWVRLAKLAAISAVAAGAAAMAPMVTAQAPVGLRLLGSAVLFGTVYGVLVRAGDVLDEGDKQWARGVVRRLTSAMAALLLVKRPAAARVDGDH